MTEMGLPVTCQPRPFCCGAQTRPCCLHPSGAPTHLPCPALSAHTEPISKCDIIAESLTLPNSNMVTKGLENQLDSAEASTQCCYMQLVCCSSAVDLLTTATQLFNQLIWIHKAHSRSLILEASLVGGSSG